MHNTGDNFICPKYEAEIFMQQQHYCTYQKFHQNLTMQVLIDVPCKIKESKPIRTPTLPLEQTLYQVMQLSIPSLQGQSLHCVKQIDMAFYNDMHHAKRTKSTLNMWRHLVKDRASQGYLGSFNKGRQLKTLNSEKYA